MNKPGVLAMQEKLKKLKYISLPFIQLEYDLSYCEAKELIRMMETRRWIEKMPDGNGYCVKGEHLKLRKIQKEEVDLLYEKIDCDCGDMLKYLNKKRSACESELIKQAENKESGKVAMQMFSELNLIYAADGMYFLCISSVAVNVLARVAREKRRSRMFEESEEESCLRIKKYFDVLFE